MKEVWVSVYSNLETEERKKRNIEILIIEDCFRKPIHPGVIHRVTPLKGPAIRKECILPASTSIIV